MKVTVEILMGRVFDVQVEKDATVEDLKREICIQDERLRPENRLFFLMHLDGDGDHCLMCDADGDGDGERCLMCDDEAPLVDYGVRDGSHVYLFFTLPGPPPDHMYDKI
ncbi:unnamed protein product [Cuscuta europaea]|uniref:Ubiquitin-like domain-containing protein n=1 Tax=Cuscuta europaea TaxID=41803 RepID=A0A9P0YWT0_CUSEU|nr:unnamed protein product [Cuscuta europaea]